MVRKHSAKILAIRPGPEAYGGPEFSKTNDELYFVNIGGLWYYQGRKNLEFIAWSITNILTFSTSGWPTSVILDCYKPTSVRTFIKHWETDTPKVDYRF